jgi:hypothetical protein
MAKLSPRLTAAEVAELSTPDELDQLEQIGLRLDALNDELLDLAAERQTILELLKQRKGTM